MLHLGRNVLLAEEGAQDAFLLEGCLSIPIALHELFDVLVIHNLFLVGLYINDD